MTQKIHSPVPYLLLTALFSLAPVFNHFYPAKFFPAIPSVWVWMISIFAAALSVIQGFRRALAIEAQRIQAMALVNDFRRWRPPSEIPAPNDVANAGRSISRLVRNVDEDLKEITPDFTLDSLKRLERFLPELLKEIHKEEDARIRLGVVGTYLGETACRLFGWNWFFNANPALKQFSFMNSTIRRNEEDFDPYDWAMDLMTGQFKMKDVLEEIQGKSHEGPKEK
jgi:hypothetical protein